MKKLLLAALLIVVSLSGAAPSVPIPLWPGRPPGEVQALPPEADTTAPDGQLIAGRRVIRLGNVSVPTLTVYKPDPTKDTGAAVVVCPGGGFHILAMDLEGTEVCDWLNSLGMTAVLLKYRVPAREGRPRFAAAVEDGQRAMGLVRYRAKELGIDPARIGLLGFSAGGELTATVNASLGRRAYPAVDEADAVDCRPNFAILIYPGGLVDGQRADAVREEVAPTKGPFPPTFIAMAENDPVRVEHALHYYLALKQAGVPAEMHLYPTGGHGYGLRRTEATVTTWPDRVADWLKAGGWLGRTP